MATLTVKNVGPIREAELEVKKHTVFIGPQGSGKSTLAKLIAICSDTDLIFSQTTPTDNFERKYNLHSYFGQDSTVDFQGNLHVVKFNNKFILNFTNPEKAVDKDALDLLDEIKLLSDNLFQNRNKFQNKQLDEKQYSELARAVLLEVEVIQNKIQHQVFKDYETTYVPAERILITTLSNAIWGITYSEINLPKMLTLFFNNYSKARNELQSLEIGFLNINFLHSTEGDQVVLSQNRAINLSQSASGYQSIIPLLLVIESQRKQSIRRFIIEEPELNLYPTAQKDLIYSLMSGLDPNVDYQDAEWVITTHSPYVLSSFNTLMLAYKVAQKSDELRAEVEKLVPARCWINPDDFAAYYVDNGTVRSIISEKTGLIDENELDGVSDTLADEQEALFELNRTARQPRA